jgi:hypothetical protein
MRNKQHLENLGVDGKTILKWISNGLDGHINQINVNLMCG